MSYRYVAVENEYGSGGGMIAKALAQRCGIPFYGRKILELVSDRLYLPVDTIEEEEETITSSFLYSVLTLSRATSGAMDMLPLTDRIFMAAQDAIRGLASEGPAVFLGHCAAHALRDRSKVLRVFIHADAETKAEMLRVREGLDRREAEQRMKRVDQRRANYFHANTHRAWADPAYYDMVLDIGTLGSDTCVELLANAFAKGGQA